ncbi:MAG: hypothetical protein LBI74_02040 [Synergistaceae bacterium]|jgi:predicted transposase/invertase (TIGR01784 family)|nr:hypothetical protein [Synergistaceae bacterium]
MIAREKARIDERARMRGEYNKGKMEGIEEGKLEVARNLLAEGMPPEVIARSVKLPIEKIRELMN